MTDERWVHITDEHSELAGYYFDVLETVQDPESIYKGEAGKLIAFKEVENGKYLIVIYKETSERGGFILTAFFDEENETDNKARKIMAGLEVEEILKLMPSLLKIPFKRMWYSYDEEADVLYINVKKPSRADDSKLTDDDIIIRYEGDEIVGITVLHASKRKTLVKQRD